MAVNNKIYGINTPLELLKFNYLTFLGRIKMGLFGAYLIFLMDPEKIKAHPIEEMLDLYVRFSQAAKENTELLGEGREEFKKLEDGDPENRKLWQWFLDESLRDFNRVYELLGVKIEHTIGESFYEPELRGIIHDALERGIAKRSDDGSVVIPIPSSSTPEIIQKSDGATIYTTRELAAIRHRIQQWNASKLLYVAANQQTFHLEQVFRSAELLGYAKPGQLVHVKFGMMLGPGGKKFATREGRLIPLVEVLGEAIQRSRAVVERLNPELPEEKKARIARAVGVGAVKYYDLFHHRLSDITFEWDQMLNLEGASAPYLQYTYARLRSILRKYGKEIGKLEIEKSAFDALEHRLLAAMLRLPEAIEDALRDYTPNTLASYLFGLAKLANEFYHSHPVLQETDAAKLEFRLALVSGIADTLKNGLGLLGIEAPEEM
ncbi:MAG: arginine--tRNA ligase [Candidatus Sungbacteria bacterium]|nr:arginine--tRNA ligase [Candidatus Sungbacteria bacterium]